MVSEERCPNCNSNEIVSDYSRGESICSNCGVVLSKLIDTTPEWRSFTAEEKSNRSRTGAPISSLKSDVESLTTEETPAAVRKLAMDVLKEI